MNRIYDLLKEGEENRIPAKELMILSGIPEERALRKAISIERRNGALILSTRANGGGYFKPKNKEEVRRFIKMFEASGRSIFAVLKSAREYVKETEGQETLSL